MTTTNETAMTQFYRLHHESLVIFERSKRLEAVLECHAEYIMDRIIKMRSLDTAFCSLNPKEQKTAETLLRLGEEPETDTNTDGDAKEMQRYFAALHIVAYCYKKGIDIGRLYADPPDWREMKRPQRYFKRRA